MTTSDAILLRIAEKLDAKIKLVSSMEHYTELEWCAIDTYNGALAEAEKIVRSFLSPQAQADQSAKSLRELGELFNI